VLSPIRGSEALRIIPAIIVNQAGWPHSAIETRGILTGHFRTGGGRRADSYGRNCSYRSLSGFFFEEKFHHSLVSSRLAPAGHFF
jgi:hypothetical protein